ncbi:SR-related and CTD-associated factor 4-like [Leptidea sinapis]|nr:SR-related and CTD-associated factor 4-like [Leptidea sinapis]
MSQSLYNFLILFSGFRISIEAKDPVLPPCPTNIQFLPQNLPMHCQMQTPPENANNPKNMPFPPQGFKFPSYPPQFYQGLPGKLPEPGLPGPMNIPPGFPGPMPLSPGYPGPLPLPPGMPGAPIPLGPPMHPGPSQKLPVIVMPFYSPDTSFKKSQSNQLPEEPRKRRGRKHKRKQRPQMHSDTDDSTESDSSTEEEGWWRGRRDGRRSTYGHYKKNRQTNRKHDLLTPMLQYVTKDGYVVFEEKISKNEAKEWLKMKAETTTDHPSPHHEDDSDTGRDHGHEYVLERKTRNEDVENRTENNLRLQRKKKLLRYKSAKQTKADVNKDVEDITT